jgi:hypothetical protein
MYIGITGVSFHVARIRNEGAVFPEVEVLRKNQHIYSCISGSKTCVLEAIYIAINLEAYKSLKGCVRSILPRLRTQYQDLFGKPFPENFKGCEIKETLDLASKLYNIKFVIYTKEGNGEG